MHKNRSREDENLTFSRAQVYLILGCVIAIAVLSFVIGRLVGEDGGGMRDETAQLQQNPLLSESEVQEEMNRLEKRLEKAAGISPMPMEESATGKTPENDEGNPELSFAEKLSGGLPDETEDETEHEIKIKTIEKIERVTIIPPGKSVAVSINKRTALPVTSAKTEKNSPATVANALRVESPPKRPVADPKRPMADIKRSVKRGGKPQVSEAQTSSEKPKQKIVNPKYTIQVGSFPSENSARKLQIRLKNKGYGSYIKKVARLRATWYRVCVGAYEKRGEAEKILDRLKNKERLEGIILKAHN